MTPVDPTPKGSLEELFRHHLLEGEAAAVPPAPHVWEQLDNSLLLQQNEQYRRRLRAYRWAMAASVLLAVLAGGGWWQSQLAGSAGRPLAGAPAGALPIGRLPAGAALPATLTHSTLGLTSSSANSFSIGQTSTFFAPAPLAFMPLPGAAYALYNPGSSGRAWRRGGRPARAAGTAPVYAATPAGTSTLPDPLQTVAFTPLWSASGGAGSLLAAESSPLDADQLDARHASLRLPAGMVPPVQLATQPLRELHAPQSSRPWQLQVAYAGGMFDPNIDFNRDPSSYNANLGPGTVATTREAAAEYRSNLRAGLSQRLSLWATRRLGIGRWSLRTGLEVSQNEASSASSVAFVGEQVATLHSYVQVLPNRLQGTTYRYRAASIPVEAVYRQPLRGGLSLYGRAGALFTALLHVRSEVDGEPDAERSYSIRSVGSPYRHLSASVRGGAGLHYQPSGQPWALNLGPVVETGIMSLNIDPTQTFRNQQRPYSVGLEAGLEFGNPLKPQPLLP